LAVDRFRQGAFGVVQRGTLGLILVFLIRTGHGRAGENEKQHCACASCRSLKPLHVDLLLGCLSEEYSGTCPPVFSSLCSFGTFAKRIRRRPHARTEASAMPCRFSRR